MADPTVDTGPRLRSRGFYRAVLLLPVVVLVALLATGRLQESIGMTLGALFGGPLPTHERFMRAWFTNLFWVLGCAPLAFASWELGRQRVAARRLGYAGLVGLRDVWRVAFGEGLSAREQATFDRPPRDRPGVALALGAAMALVVPAFFSLAAPPLRTPSALLWLGVTGLLVGTIFYCHRRAMAYLVDEPGKWDVFRQYRLLNPGRYAEAGRRFVRLQIALSMLLPVWWLVGGVLFAFGR